MDNLLLSSKETDPYRKWEPIIAAVLTLFQMPLGLLIPVTIGSRLPEPSNNNCKVSLMRNGTFDIWCLVGDEAMDPSPSWSLEPILPFCAKHKDVESRVQVQGGLGYQRSEPTKGLYWANPTTRLEIIISYSSEGRKRNF